MSIVDTCSNDQWVLPTALYADLPSWGSGDIRDLPSLPTTHQWKGLAGDAELQALHFLWGWAM